LWNIDPYRRSKLPSAYGQKTNDSPARNGDAVVGGAVDEAVKAKVLVLGIALVLRRDVWSIDQGPVGCHLSATIESLQKAVWNHEFHVVDGGLDDTPVVCVILDGQLRASLALAESLLPATRHGT
jgi:hypothetical protein